MSAVLTSVGSQQADRRSGNAALSYTHAGSGIAVIVPLCFGTTLAGVEAASGQRSFLEAIGAGHELIAYDQGGIGASFEAGSASSWKDRGAELWAVADAAGVERAVLYGVFDAGYTIAHAAVQQPDRVLGLIFNLVPPMIGAAGPDDGVPEPLSERWFGASGLSPRERALAALDGIGVGRSDAEALSNCWARETPSIEQELVLLRQADLRPLGPSLRARSLVIAPARRALVTRWGATLAGLLPAATLIRPSRAGEILGGIHGFLALIDIDEGHYASHLAPDVSLTVGEAEHSVAALQRIVVPVVDTLSSERAAEMASRLGGPQQAELVLVHVVEIPLTRALTDIGDAERELGERALRLGQAIAARHGLRSRTRLLFERSAARGIVRVAGEERADLIVMTIGQKRRPDPTEVSTTMRDVLRHAPCEVLVDQARHATERDAFQGRASRKTEPEGPVGA